ncbi:MAG: DmsC/YnfH family molybdoenzyme membrane anchor subunit [Longimicrobiales bacterium]|nr:DmsC/YnfH family molybdoenzyme membrane anchor subunit [Longimicrobiales bacterium]
MSLVPDAPPAAGRAAALPLGFLFDPNRCTGCAACSLACSTENELGWGRSWRQIVPFNPELRPGVPAFHLSLACNHCAEAPCVAHCPTGAMRRDASTGAVVVDEALCIGCRYCGWVCPWDAPRFDEDRGVMTKCTLCNHRLREGGQPACVEACPTAALGCGAHVGDERIPGFPNTPARPRIRFTPLRRGAAPPESTWSLPADVLEAVGPTQTADPAVGRAVTPSGVRAWAAAGISFRSELPLWLFTSGAAALVGWVLAATLGGPAVTFAGFAAAAAATLVVSTLHLGRTERAWRALTNVRTSHLSREIAGYGAFLAASALWLAWGRAGAGPGATALEAGPAALGHLAAALGLLALFLIDRVYDPVRAPTGRPVHSGDALLMGAMVTGVLLRAPGPFLVLAAAKLALYLRRHRRHALAGPTRAAFVAGRLHPAWPTLRLAGLVLPPLLWVLTPEAWPGWAILLVAAAELLDRAELYREIRVPTPWRQAREDAAAWMR